MSTFKPTGSRIDMPSHQPGGRPKRLRATGDLPTLRTGPYTMGYGTNEMPNSVTPGDPGMRADNRYGKKDKMPPMPDLFGIS